MSGVSISPTAMTLPVWLVVSVLALLALTAVFLTFRASRVDALIRVTRTEALIVTGVVICLGVGISLWSEYQTTLRREALEDRMIALQARAQSSAAALACVEDNAGEAVDAGCERTIFASPQAVAAATSFTAARFALLADAARYTGRHGARFDALLAGLRKSLERDRFGLLANFLTVRENCTPDQCDGLAVLQNPTGVQQNLKTHAFEANLARHASAWTKEQPAKEQPAENVATAPAAAEPAPQQSAARGAPLPKDYVLPSAESIPPISIMTNEPAAAPPPARPRPAGTPTASEARPEKPLRPVRRPPPAAATNMSNAPLALTPPSVAE